MTTIAKSRATAHPLAQTGLFASIASRLAAYRRNRRVLRDLSAMEDHLLRDIGLSRIDIDRASIAEFGADRMAMLDRARARRMS